jgi:hypothetical protein
MGVTNGGGARNVLGTHLAVQAFDLTQHLANLSRVDLPDQRADQ